MPCSNPGAMTICSGMTFGDDVETLDVINASSPLLPHASGGKAPTALVTLPVHPWHSEQAGSQKKLGAPRYPST